MNLQAPGAPPEGLRLRRSRLGAAPGPGLDLSIEFGALFVRHAVVWLGVWALLPLALGWRPYVIVSGSMEPSIRAGDIVVAAPPDMADIGPGTVVVFDNAGRLTTHRIAAVGEDGTYATKGDANPEVDSSPIEPGQIRGTGRLLVPMIGLPYLWWWSGQWLLVVTAVVVLTLAVAYRRAGGSSVADGPLGSAAGLRRLLVIGALVATVAVGALQLSGATFAGQTSNPGNTFAAAAAFCASPGSQTLSAVADTYVAQDSATTNFGTSGTLDVTARSSRNRRVLVTFTLPSLPAGCDVTVASLQLLTTNASAGRVYQAWRASAAWAESTVTWNTQPGTTGTASTATTGSGLVSWDVATSVTQMYAGANNGFLIRDSVEDTSSTFQNRYSSLEGGTAPVLVLSWS
jgi:signal peptidase I